MKDELDKISTLLKTHPELGLELFRAFKREHSDTFHLLGRYCRVWYKNGHHDFVHLDMFAKLRESNERQFLIIEGGIGTISLYNIAYLEKI